MEDTIYVLNKYEQVICVFNKYDTENRIVNPRVQNKQNSESIFTFQIALNNPKWEQIKDPENLYKVNGKVYSANFDGCFTEIRNENNEDLVNVTAYEIQKLLSRKYVRAWNSEVGFEKIDVFMVVIVANGSLELQNDGALVRSKHEKGTSGYILDGLLYGTGWSTGICDIEDKFDFETDQINIYDNILKVQEMFGGILVFDSLNKIVHHRDETKFLNYSGYEVKYQKNMQTAEQIYNNKIITKLCPLGEGGLNISNVNEGNIWLTNFTYTDSVYEAIENNADIYEPEQLKRWGERKLEQLSKPRKELTAKLVDMRRLPGYENEVFDLNDIVDVIDYQFIGDTIEKLRVIGWEYGVFSVYDATVELGNITLDTTDIFKQTSTVTNIITNGTLSSNKVVVINKGGTTLEENLYIADQKIQQNEAKITKTDKYINLRVDSVESDIDSLNNVVVNQTKILSDLNVGLDGLKYSYYKEGGNNLIKNSDMANGANFWLRHLGCSYYQSDTPPENPKENDYWFCTSNFESYKTGQMYIYKNNVWVESNVTRKQLDLDKNYTNFIYSNETEEARKNTVSGRILFFDTDILETHLFSATNFTDYKVNETNVALGFKIRNNIKTGVVYIGIAYLDKTQEEFERINPNEALQGMYVQDLLFTPDDYNQDYLESIKLEKELIKKTQFLPVISGITSPTDTKKLWMDTTIPYQITLKEYVDGNWVRKTKQEETGEYNITINEDGSITKEPITITVNENMTCYDENTNEIFFCSLLTNGFYNHSTLSIYDEIKSLAVIITHYGGFYIANVGTDAEGNPSILEIPKEVIPVQKNLYWLDYSKSNGEYIGYAWRTKYDGDTFVEWAQTDISTQYVIEHQVDPSVFPSPLQVRPTGHFEISDLKLQWNSIATSWNRYSGEIYGKSYKMDERGFSIISGVNEMFIDEDEIVATNRIEVVFRIKGDETYLPYILTKRINFGENYTIQETNINGEIHLTLF